MIERLLPHIRQFVRVRRRWSAPKPWVRRSLSCSTTRCRRDLPGLVRDDRSGQRPCPCHPSRRRRLGGSGRLPARPAGGRRRQLGRLLAPGSCPRSGGQAAGGSITVSRTPVLPPLALHANPVGVPHAGFGGGGVAALVLIVDPGAKPRIDPEQVAATPARLRAAAELVARLGGWLGSNAPPGAHLMWHGYTQLATMTLRLRAARRILMTSPFVTRPAGCLEQG